MSNAAKCIFLIWTLLLALSAIGFTYFAARPNVMLWVESAHPSSAYQRGRELKNQGCLQEALAAFQQGCQYFQQIAQQTQLRKHRNQYIQGLLEMASVWEQYGDPQSLREAIDGYSQAIALDPAYADGQPAMQKGLLLQRMEHYSEALESFTIAIENGSALVALESLFGRGTCRYEMGEIDAACTDWAPYVRYKRDIPLTALENLSTLPIPSCTEALFVRARAAQALGDRDQANRFFTQYLEMNPACRMAQFYGSPSTRQSWIDLNANCTVEDLFPHREEYPYPIYSSLLDLYASSAMGVDLVLELSPQVNFTKPPQLQIERNLEPISSVVVLSAQADFYTVAVDLEPGMNLIHFRTLPDSELLTVTPVLLHSLSVRTKLPG